MRAIVSFVAGCLAAMSLGACASPPAIRSDVTTFNDAQALAAEPRSFRIEPTAEQADSLEYKLYADLVRDALLIAGLTEGGPDARFAAAFSYAINPQDIVVREIWYDEPFMPWYGPGRRWGYGWGYDPFWGGPPMTRETTRQVWRRELRLELREAASGRKVYEGSAVSVGSTAELNPIMPYLVRALFDDFPGGNGATRHVDLPVER